MNAADILFRGKAINREPGIAYRTNYKNGDWVYGLITNKHLRENEASMTNCAGVSGIEVDASTLSQFIGLYDSTHTPIFDGDIVLVRDCLCLVKYDQARCAFVFMLTENAYNILDVRELDKAYFRVVGNRYSEADIEKYNLQEI